MQCPTAHDYDPFSPSYLADPYPTLQDLRDSAPVFYSPRLKAFLVTRYEHAEQVLQDRATHYAPVMHLRIPDRLLVRPGGVA